MIVGTLDSIQTQIVQRPSIMAALAYLQELDLETIQDGRYEVQDDRIFSIIQSYLTEMTADSVEVEGHRKYIDVYWMLAGSDQFGWIPTNKLEDLPKYDADKDVWKKVVKAPMLSYITLTQDDVAVLFPEDAHVAQLAVKEPATARKVILKVAV